MRVESDRSRPRGARPILAREGLQLATSAVRIRGRRRATEVMRPSSRKSSRRARLPETMSRSAGNPDARRPRISDDMLQHAAHAPQLGDFARSRRGGSRQAAGLREGWSRSSTRRTSARTSSSETQPAAPDTNPSAADAPRRSSGSRWPFAEAPAGDRPFRNSAPSRDWRRSAGEPAPLRPFART